MTVKANKAEIAKQISNAFEFIQKLYNESAYLIKEIEGQLAKPEYNFEILKPGGYGVSTRSSSSLEPTNINFWLMRRFAVAFVEPIAATGKKKKHRSIDKNLKVLYFRIILNDGDKVPQLVFGVLYQIKVHKEWIDKFEKLMTDFEYVENKLFAKFPLIDYQDSKYSLKGSLQTVNLLEINSSDELMKKVILPAVKLYKKV